MITATTRRTWIKPPALKAKSPKAHSTTRMIKIVSSIPTSSSYSSLPLVVPNPPFAVQEKTTRNSINIAVFVPEPFPLQERPGNRFLSGKNAERFRPIESDVNPARGIVL